jgi:hypothetical protein
MNSVSFERLLKASRLAMPAMKDELIADRSIRIARADRDELVGKIQKSRGNSGGSSARQNLTSKLSQRLKTKPPRGTKLGGSHAGMAFDPRQRAVVKVHYFGHGGAGRAALREHTKYVARDSAVRPPDTLPDMEPADGKGAADDANRTEERAARPERWAFYDAEREGVDGLARTDAWGKADKRHFRVILSAENGAHLRDLPAYTREVMARAETALGTKLSWVAADHHDTDNPHTHVIIRGRRANGQDLVLPRDFIRHSFRGIAQDVATEWLGGRSREDARLALDRETRRHGPSRLDRLLEGQVKPGEGKRLADVRAHNGSPELTQALKARMRELERMGLGAEIERNVIRLAPDWRERLQAMELHLDIRKRIVRERMERIVAPAQQHQIAQHIRKGLIDR